MNETLPVMHLFNMINYNLGQAVHDRDLGVLDTAARHADRALQLVELLQVGTPSDVRLHLKPGKLEDPKNWLGSIIIMFEYQMLRWGVTKEDFDDTYFADEEPVDPEEHEAVD